MAQRPVRAVLCSAACKHAIRAAIFLARHPEGATASQIADECDLPAPFAALILTRLARKCIVRSSKGAHGGFSLRRDPAKIRIADLVAALGEEDYFSRCGMGYPQCSPHAPCAMHHGWRQIRGSIQSYLKRTTIAKLAAQP